MISGYSVWRSCRTTSATLLPSSSLSENCTVGAAAFLDRVVGHALFLFLAGTLWITVTIRDDRTALLLRRHIHHFSVVRVPQVIWWWGSVVVAAHHVIHVMIGGSWLLRTLPQYVPWVVIRGVKSLRCVLWNHIRRLHAFLHSCFRIIEVHTVLHLDEWDALIVCLQIGLVISYPVRTIILARCNDLMHLHLTVAADIEDIVADTKGLFLLFVRFLLIMNLLY